jgi:hypothetical protein
LSFLNIGPAFPRRVMINHGPKSDVLLVNKFPTRKTTIELAKKKKKIGRIDNTFLEMAVRKKYFLSILKATTS